MVVRDAIMEPEAAVRTALDALALADTDAAYWLHQYRRCVEDVRDWVEASPVQEAESAPRYRLLQQTLEDTRYGLDYAVRRASDARQELANSRQFFLALQTNTLGNVTASSTASSSIATITTDSSGAQFRIRPSAAATSSTLQATHPVQTPPSLGEIPGQAGSGPSSLVSRVSPLKRPGAETVYLAPAKRAKHPRSFKWDDNLMHYFPKEFTIPVCPLGNMWQYWVCGDEIAKYPPFRILVASELEDSKTKRTLSSLRFVMLEIESRVLAQGAWVDNPSPKDAADMLEAVKESIAARPAAKRGELQPVEALQWTSLGRILRDQKKMEQEDDEE